ncbi:hypothetical protein [Microvirga sp. 2TAF3]|uniref:hypothetical protein n=1 Tax=Microvirga sp. 2TAF3 TaxID=3233014 RepID=UPI003F995695
MGEVAHSLYETEDYDLAAYFDSLSRMVPADSDVGEDLAQTLLNFEIEKAVAGHEGCFERAQEAAADLAICAVSSSLLASVLGLNVWCFDQLAFNSGGHDFVVEHVATPAHAMRIQQRRTQGIRTQLTARAFWALKDRAFPNLRFGIDVEAQIGAFDAGLLPLLFRRLADLDRRVALWREAGAFPETLPPITPESEETMRQYGPARNFRNAQGRNQTFEDHIWVDSLHRIHLFRHADVKLIEIGYVGRHLPTIRHPT